MLAYFDHTALLTSDGHDDGELLHVPALISQAGIYTDKNITLTTADFDNAVREFAPVALNYEHKRGPLDGRLGQLRTIWREGERLFGKVSVPKWLHFALSNGGERPKLSAEFNLLSKRLTGCAWTANLRISEAGLIAAFSIAGNPAGTATFAQDKPLIYFGSMSLSQNDVDKLLRHWKIEKNAAFPTEAAVYKTLQETLNALHPMNGGAEIFNRIVGRGAKK